jgi:cysteine desulfurase
MKLADGSVYLDANATMPMYPEAADAFLKAEKCAFANPSSPYPPGKKAREVLEGSRMEILRRMNYDGELIFTGSGTEANHLAVLSAAASRKEKRVLISTIEHPSCYELRNRLGEIGVRVDEFGVDAHGVIDLNRLEELLKTPASLAVVISAHNETGVIQPVGCAIKMCGEKGVLFHTDAVQAFGKIDLPSGGLTPDTAAVAAHKIGGPKGIGALFFSKGTKIIPMLTGGGQEKGLRASTEAVTLAAAFAAAAKSADPGSFFKIHELRDLMEERIAGLVAYSEFFGKNTARLPNTSFFSAKGKDGRIIQQYLAERGFYVGTGSACHGSGSGIPRVLREMGRPDSSYPVRVSLSKFSTAQEINDFVDMFSNAVKVV